MCNVMSELEDIYEILGIFCYLNFPNYLSDIHMDNVSEIKYVIKNKIKILTNYIEILESINNSLTNVNSKENLKEIIATNKIKLNQMISDYDKIK